MCGVVRWARICSGLHGEIYSRNGKDRRERSGAAEIETTH